MTAATQLTFSF